MIVTKCRIGLTQDREQTETDSKHKVPTLRAETWCKSQNASTPCFFLYFKHFHLSFIFNSVTFGHLYYESATFCVRGNPKEIYQVRQIFLIMTKVLHTYLHNTDRPTDMGIAQAQACFTHTYTVS